MKASTRLRDVPFARRSLIRGLGLTAASLGTSGTRRTARAQGDSSPPTRLILYLDGSHFQDAWRPIGINGAPMPTEFGWDFGEAHRPLEPFRDYALYPTGLAMLSIVFPGLRASQPGGHPEGEMGLLTGASEVSLTQRLHGGPSIDQFIGKQINKDGLVTRFPTLAAAVGENFPAQSAVILSAGRAQRIPSIHIDPLDFYQKVFADYLPANNSGSADLMREQQLAVMGFARDRYRALQTRLGKSDAERLAVHLDLIADLERRLKVDVKMAGSCVVPSKPNYDTCVTCLTQDRKLIEARHVVQSEYNVRQMVAALACDLTRVAVLNCSPYEHPRQSSLGYKPGDFGTNNLHEYDHLTATRRAEPAFRAFGIRMNQERAKALANFLQQLKDVPQAGGGNLLDHSVVLWCGHIGYGDHQSWDLPWVLFGKGGGAIKSGRYLNFGPRPDIPGNTWGWPHNDLLITLAHTMGVPVETFGEPSLCRGPLPGIRGG